jgi:outer membrane protein
MKKFSYFLLCGLSFSASAADLMDVYTQALQSDPKFQSAYAGYLANKESVPIARAQLLPTVAATGAFQAKKDSRTTLDNPVNTLTNTYESRTFSLNLSQPIFNVANWSKLRQASATAKQAQATYDVAAQDLMIRVAKAYFKILEAEDNLRFTQAEKIATAKQLDQAKQRYKVGLDAITSVYDAQASYDLIVAQEIASQNDLVNRQAELREITGSLYTQLAPLKNKLPLVSPQPANLQAWIDTAKQQNFNINAARYAVDAAKQNVNANFAGHLPVLSAVASYGESNVSREMNGPGQVDTSGSIVGLQLSVPLFAGGGVTAQTHQAQYSYQKSLADLEDVYRSTLSLTSQYYNSVNAYISKLKADRQAILSNESSLRSTEAAFKVGTRTIVDVLLAQKNLFQAQRLYTADQYAYINGILALKQQAGTLNPGDLQEIDTWLQSDTTSRQRAPKNHS